MQDTWSLIFDNVRFGEILAPDMLSIVAELDLGERLLGETIERYGVPAVHGAMTYACDAAAERMSTALAAIPDGTWVGEDLIDCDAAGDDEEYRVRVTVTKRGGRAEVDFSGTSRQARTCINATPLDAKTTVGIAFKYLFDPEGWFTSGAMRAVDLVIPEGTVVSALPPDGAVFAYWEQSQVMLSAVLRALAQGVGEAAIAGDRGSADIHSANGVRPDGSTVDLGRPGRRRDRRLRRQPPRRRRHADALVPGERDRGCRRVGRVRRAGRRAPPRARARHRRRRATTAAAPRCCATRSGSRRPSTT